MLLVSGFVTSGPVAADFILSPYQLVLAAKNNNIVFVLRLKLFLMDILYAADVTPVADKARTVLEANAQKQKSGFPIMAIKAMLSAISIFSPRDREEKNAPLTDTAC